MTKEELKKEAQEQVNRCTPLYPECFIQGYIASAGSREKRIEELEQELAVEKDLLQEETNLHLHAEDYIKSLEQKLEQTEKEMKAQITQAHIDGYNRGYAKAKEKIADIKANCDLAIEGRDVKIMELEKDFRICEKNADTYYDQRTKAIELLKKWVELYKPKLEGYPITPIQEQTEQFIKEIEK